jgi:hypothetical protein
MEQGNGGTIPIGKGEVVITDAAGVPYNCTYSTPSGEFFFDQIPAGEYQIFSEYTASFSQKIDLVLDENTPHADGLELKLYASISGVDNTASSNAPTFTIFPNPVHSFLKVQISMNEPDQVVTHIYNHMGQLMYKTSWQLPAGKFQQEINLSDLPPDIYLITIQDSHFHWQSVKKFVKN